jgi:ABC-type nitrate/sulfonate/bicarbonate transport system permease component
MQSAESRRRVQAGAPIATGARPRPRRRSGRLTGLLLIAAVLLLWEAGVQLTQTPVYLVPGPLAIATNLARHWQPLLQAGAVTFAEAVGGLLLGTMVGLALAIVITFWSRLEQGVLSLAILIKSTPIIAIAPILTIWLGFGPGPKIAVTMLLTFFPVLVNALSGFRHADPALIEYMRSLDASPQEIFLHVRWPGARPYLFAALKVVAPLSLIGTVVAEWMGASTGLGRAMWLAYANLNMPALFAAVVVLTILSTSLYQAVVWAEGRFIFWNNTVAGANEEQ